MKKAIVLMMILTVALSAQDITNTVGSNGNFDIKDASTTFLRVQQSNGNVGIGTTGPYGKLDVRGGMITQTTTDFSLTSSGTAIGFSLGAQTGNTYGQITVGTTGDNAYGNLALLPGGGNVGIGTTSPAEKLHVLGTATTRIEVESSGSSDASFKATTPNSSYGWYADGASDFMGLWDYNDATTRMVIDGNGYVGIGTTTPVGRFDVAGFGYGIVTGIAMIPDNDIEGGHYITFHNSTNTGIGSIARGAGGSVVYNTSSDYRLKENVKELDIQTTLEKIRHARPVSYTWKSDGSPDVGFIAHELEEAGFDYAVSGEKDAVDEKGNILPQAVDYGRITPEILRAVQYLLNENDALQNKIELITAENSELKSENSGIRAENVEIKKQMESLASDVEAIKEAMQSTAGSLNFSSLVKKEND